MDKRRQINRIVFHFLDLVLPTYDHCRWGNKVKNIFARKAFSHVGKHVNWGRNILIAEDFQIGDHSGVGDGARISKGVIIGNDVMIGKNLRIITKNHKIERTDIPMRLQGFTRILPLTIEDDVWIGDCVIITPGCAKLGKGSVVGAGSVVTKDVKPYSVVGGNPAKIIRYRK